MSVIDGQTDDNTTAILTVLSTMLLVIWLMIITIKKFYFNHKIYGKFPFLESYKNRGDLNLFY